MADHITPTELDAAISVLQGIIDYEYTCVRESRAPSAHCMRRSCEDVLEILKNGLDDVELER